VLFFTIDIQKSAMKSQIQEQLHCLEMNNYGAKYMEKRQYDKGISAFCNALKSASNYIENDGEEEEDEWCCSEDPGLKCCLEHQKRQAVSHFYLSEDYLEENWASDLFVHTQPIFIAEHTARRMMTHSCMTSIVMFNLALAHHVKALAITIRGGAQRSQNQQELFKARKVYQLCHIMLRDMHIEDAGVHFMIMLLVNNMGQINIVLKAHEEATRCFEQLLSLQMLLLDCDDETTWMNLDGIVHNTSRFILNGACQVAAAA
jgi:tetratricopeptide (TPR) repeat protein